MKCRKKVHGYKVSVAYSVIFSHPSIREICTLLFYNLWYYTWDTRMSSLYILRFGTQ